MALDARKLFSSVARGQQPPIDCPIPYDTLKKNAQKAIKNAAYARSTVQKFSDALAIKLDQDPGYAVILGPLKEEHRIIQKAVARYDGDVTEVSDIARSRIRLISPAQVKIAKDALSSTEFRDAMAEKGVTILQVEDRFETPTETKWRGLVIKIDINLGKGRSQKAEVMMLPRGWYPDYETTHTYLENIRALKDRARAMQRELKPDEQLQVANYIGMAAKIHNELAARDGYDVLERQPGRSNHLRLVPTSP